MSHMEYPETFSMKLSMVLVVDEGKEMKTDSVGVKGEEGRMRRDEWTNGSFRKARSRIRKWGRGSGEEGMKKKKKKRKKKRRMKSKNKRREEMQEEERRRRGGEVRGEHTRPTALFWVPSFLLGWNCTLACPCLALLAGTSGKHVTLVPLLSFSPTTPHLPSPALAMDVVELAEAFKDQALLPAGQALLMQRVQELMGQGIDVSSLFASMVSVSYTFVLDHCSQTRSRSVSAE